MSDADVMTKAVIEIDAKVLSEVVAKVNAKDDNFSKVMGSVLGSAEKLKAVMTSGLGFQTFMSIGKTAMSTINKGITGIIGDMQKTSAAWGELNQAMDGLTKTVSAKLQPAYDEVATLGIKAVGKLTDCFSQIDGDALASGIGKGVETLSKYLDAFTENMAGVPEEFGGAFSAIGKELGKIVGKFGSDKSIESFGDAVHTAAGYLKTFAGFLKDNADKVVGLLKGLPILLATVKGFKMFRAVTPLIETLTGAFSGLGKSSLGKLGRMFLGLSEGEKQAGDAGKKTSEAVTSLKTGFNSFQKSAGIALIIGALAGLALALQPLAELGVTAVVPLLTFGAVVAGLGVVLSKVGADLEESMLGIVAFAAAVSIMALAMVPIAATGTEGAVAMGMFGIAVAALAIVFAQFGGLLNEAIPGMLSFGATVLMVGAGMALASVMIEALTPFLSQLGITVTQVAMAIAMAVTIIIAAFASLVPIITAAVTQIVNAIGTTLVNVMQTAGEIITQIVESISEGFSTITEGVSGVIDSISGGFTSILEAIADIITAIGESALNAGRGFQLVAKGIKMITELSIIDVGAALLAVATGLGEIAGKGEGLQNAAEGMTGINLAITTAATAASLLNGLLMQLAVLSLNVAASIAVVTAAFSGFVIPPLDIGPMLAGFAAITIAAMTMGMQLTVVGLQAGTGFTSMFSNGIIQAVLIAVNVATAIISALRAAEYGAYTCGWFIGMGLANGMRASLAEVQAVAEQLAVAAEKAVIAKSKIGSPSRVFKELGGFIGEGFAIGIESMGNLIRHVSEEMVFIPDVPAFEGMSMGNYSFGNQELQSDYSYHPAIYVNAEVRSIMDGKEVGYGSARYVREKNEKEEKVRRYVSGVR
ncbi:hypothetical protein HGO97_011735 [Faecalicatena sp. AGMB00832]|uniref:Phage-related protein n=1 Tax=Faecalicatena faecalis TaxID=2726362 RepID=A0ABS6D4G2_9FIRM|nr:hypothetical protein [Faecalicatena faecalis]MBU3876482.1 hypothetical protein [Faecalicatena faecalis]